MRTESSFSEHFSDIIVDLLNIRDNKNISKAVLINQVLFTGYEAFLIIAIISLLLSAVIIHQGYGYLNALGQTDWIYQILVSSIVRDLGPLITSLIILTRSGTAISTELGNMKINKEIDALKAFGISPISYIVTPRIVGMVVSIVILIIYFSIIGLFGGYIVSNIFHPLPFSEFFKQFINALTFLDLFIMIIKTAVSGFAISVICSFHGLSVSRSITEIPQRNIKAVAQSVYAILFINILGIIVYVSIG